MIVITGASDGLGLELAKLYKRDGTTVVNVSRTKCECADTNILQDLREGKQIDAAAEAIEAMDEQLEAVINCAGVLTVEALGDISEEEVKRVMATNVRGPILLVSNLIDRIKREGTDIVNVSTAMATKPRADHTVYLASKWALRGFTINLQEELKSYPSRVISFCPGGFETKIYQKISNVDNSVQKGPMMSVAAVALCLKQLLDLPKNMEVSEIIINRKKVK